VGWDFEESSFAKIAKQSDTLTLGGEQAKLYVQLAFPIFPTPAVMNAHWSLI
jgi:hypothetical protein